MKLLTALVGALLPALAVQGTPLPGVGPEESIISLQGSLPKDQFGNNVSRPSPVPTLALPSSRCRFPPCSAHPP
jgi:hypothetical protein